MKTELFTPEAFFVISLMNFVSSTRVYEVVFVTKELKKMKTCPLYIFLSK